MSELRSLSRRSVLRALTALGVGSIAFRRALAVQVHEKGGITAEMIKQAEWIAGLELEEGERELIAKSLEGNLKSAERIRQQDIDFGVVPAQVFRPDLFYSQARSTNELRANHVVSTDPATVQVAWSVGSNVAKIGESDIPFASIQQQADLLASKHLSSSELTQIYLTRIKQYDSQLKSIVSLLEEHALQLAKESDQRRAERRSRGILDGIPWLAKDIIAIPPWKTTWGAEPFKDQIRPETATVAKRMAAAGAVVLGKSSVGALAWGDVWFGGTTRNPWNVEQGSSGSSAGSASAVAAGLTTFALGSETLGSIVSPCRRCRTSGLRPTFGRVSRYGCMTLAWSMDKIGPIARHVNDLALVFASLIGIDEKDPSTVERNFLWPLDRPLSDVTVGVDKGELGAMEQRVLEFLTSQGAQVKEIDLTSKIPVDALSIVLGVEAAAVFERPFRANRKANYGLWSNTFRNAQFVSAVHFLQANRLRSELIIETERKLAEVDVVLGGEDLTLTNLTGHPSLIVSCGTEKVGGIDVPGVVKFTAAAYREGLLLHLGGLVQRALPPVPNQPELG
jgi:Asp-tRNA(Asn)/Glu-tRNA(Gln) amidotransferase A subunit family amidase